MTPGVSANGRAPRWTLVLALVVAGISGFFVGRGDWRPGNWRTIEVQELPIGALASPIALELPPLPPAPVRNVVLLVVDGMGVTQVDAARWAALGQSGRFVFERFPVVGLTTTAAVGEPVTESAAAATALATGVATTLGAVGVDPDGRRLRTLVEAARDAGFTTGMVTTSEIHDATPAAFAAHVADRGARAEVAAQLAASGLDLMVGGGREQFEPLGARGTRTDRRDLLQEARARGVAVVDSERELAAAGELPLWALFRGRLDLPGSDPPLGRWAEQALRLLAARAAARGAGFFLLLEEEGVDSAGHRMNLVAMARAMVRVDAAAGVATRFAIEDGRTLVLVVGDHATGGPSLDETTTAERLRVAWAIGKHTGEAVPIYAYGPAGSAERFTGSYPQHEVARRLAELLGLDLSANWKGTS